LSTDRNPALDTGIDVQCRAFWHVQANLWRMITRCAGKVAYMQAGFGGNQPYRCRLLTQWSGKILRKKNRPLLNRLCQAYVRLLLTPESTDGSRTVSLARYGAYEVRLVEFSHRPVSDDSSFWVRLDRRGMQCSLDSCWCDDLDDAETAAEHFVSRARQLNNHGSH
jgi:hypothetical protein